MNNFVKRLFKSLLCVAVALPAFVSCFDDEALWDKLEDLEFRLDSLENNLNNQVAALNALMTDGSTINSCKKNADGSYVIELSNGTKFTAMPEDADFSSLVSYVEVDGKKCWATYDAAGELVALAGKNGPIPVESQIEVKIVDGVYYLVVDGEEFETGVDAKEVVQVFSSINPLKDESGQVYAVEFTFGDGWAVTVTVDGYKGVLFKLSSVNTAVLSEYFIDYGQSQTFLMDTKGIVDYVMQIPDGWRVKESIDKLTGETYVTITAPTQETVAMGAAESVGALKVVSVVDGGKAAVTKLTLSAEPFKTYNVTVLRAEITPYKGVQKFIYGITPLTSFDKAKILEEISKHVYSFVSLPDGMTEVNEPINLAHEEIYPEINEEQTYIFWSLPILYKEAATEEESGFYYKEEQFMEYNLTPMSASIEVVSTSLLNAELKVKVTGTKQMYAGVYPNGEKVIDEIITAVNNGAYEPVTDPEIFIYNGVASKFPNPSLESYLDYATSYVAWLIPVEEGKTVFTASDVIYKEFKTKEIKEGGSLTATVSEAATTVSSISQKITCENAAMIYYAYLDATTGGRYSGDGIGNATKFKYLTESDTFKEVRGNSAETLIDALMPESTMWLFTVPVGHDGLYGKVSCVSATTEPVSFNELSVEVKKVEALTEEATLKVSVTGGEAAEYIYWAGRVTDPFWVETCGKDISTAEKFIAANPDNSVITKVMRANGPVASDGTLHLTNLAQAKEHVVLVLAKDASGNFSKAGYCNFETSSLILGDNYQSEGSDTWNETKAWIEENINWIKESFRDKPSASYGYANYSFNIKIPQNLTAFISTSIPDKFDPDEADLCETIIAFENYCSETRDMGGNASLTEEQKETLKWYDDKGKEHSAAAFFNVYETYAHGAPQAGRVTYFSAAGHNEINCPTWVNGVCENYESKAATIANKMSLEYWIQWVHENCNYAYAGDPNHQYSYSLTDEAKITALAQAWVDIYTDYYKDAKPIVYVNDGNGIQLTNAYAAGTDSTTKEVLDRVYVILKDDTGSYYDPMIIQVPDYYTKK